MDTAASVLRVGMTGGLIGLAVALIVAAAAGMVLRRRSGRFRTVSVPATPLPGRAANDSAGVLTGTDLGTALGERATLVQFSTAFCAPCRPTRQILGQVAGMVEGVVHVDIDATSRLDLVRRLRVNSTPTVLVLGPDGEIARRATGLPRKADVIAALGLVIDPATSRASSAALTGNVTGPGSDSRSESE
jgi:thiol-disulfide isomerase/thioredoxin